MAVGLIGLGLQWKYPEQGWFGKWVMIAGLGILAVTLIAFVVRWLTIREFERHHPQVAQSAQPIKVVKRANENRNEFNPHLAYNPQNVFNPNINVNVPVSQSQRQEKRVEEKRTRDPVFESRGTRFRRYGFNMQTGELIRDQYDGGDVYDYIRFVDAALVRFLYRADPGVDPRLRVNAHISIYTDNESPPRGEWTVAELKALGQSASHDIYKPIWDNDEPHVSIEFSAGDTHELIVALVPVTESPRGIIGYEHGNKKVSSYMGTEHLFAPELHNLEAGAFLIRVELIPKVWNDVRCKLPTFWFQLLLGEKSVLVFLRTI